MASPQYDCRRFLLKRKYLTEDGLFNKLKVFENRFLLLSDDYIYKSLEDEDVEDDVINLIHKDPQFLEESSSYYVKDIVRNLKAICKLPGLKPGTYFGPDPIQAKYIIPLRNLNLALDIDSKEITYRELPMSKYMFSTYRLPYDFDKRAKSKLFQDLINELFVQDEQDLLQEWFGYNLIPVNSAQKFFLGVGDGANGKGAVSVPFRNLLGKENVDDNTLDALRGKNRFDLASTEGKLAVIVDEVDVKKPFPTDKLKRYVGGSPVIFERKNKQGRKAIPTARWTILCNSLPMFQDLTDGTMRRILILYFKKQFLDESKQNKELLEDSYWTPELSGIFNWALVGLERLLRNNWKFTVPESSITSLKNYKLAMNPPVGFLQDYIEYSDSGEVTTIDLYQAYCGYCRIYGFRVENSEIFGRYVKKEFPRAIQSKNPLHRKNGRTRVWYGLTFKNNRDPLELEAGSAQLAQINAEVLSSETINALKKDDLCALEKATLYVPEIRNE